MTRFYDNIRQRMAPARALREAQLHVLRRGRHPPTGTAQPTGEELERAEPYYWAAWVISGDPGERFGEEAVVSDDSAVAHDSAPSPPPGRSRVGPVVLGLAVAAGSAVIGWVFWRRVRKGHLVHQG
jgi:hypothetical protein